MSELPYGCAIKALVMHIRFPPKSTALPAVPRVCIEFHYRLKLRTGRSPENANILKVLRFLNAPFQSRRALG